MSLARIPCTIVTGFLGAGKTTLIRHMLQNPQGRRLAVIVNEFGDVGMDAEILRGCGAEACDDAGIIELANGCICCTVADDFVPALDALLALNPQPDHILIETSGLALPKPLVQAFQWPAIRGRVTVDGVVAVVDGEALSRAAWRPIQRRWRPSVRPIPRWTMRIPSRRSSRTRLPAPISWS
jgi:cobalamin biosynthesis protein CobW